MRWFWTAARRAKAVVEFGSIGQIERRREKEGRGRRKGEGGRRMGKRRKERGMVEMRKEEKGEEKKRMQQ